MKNKLIILTGPTAVGKTSLSIKLAQQLNGEIISADSMQIYKKLDIGSAKITKEEMKGIKHYLIDELEPDEEFNVFVFKKMATEALDSIYSNNHIPIIVGGTGFYIQALLYDINFEEEDNSQIRKDLEKMAAIKGAKYMHDELMLIDPVYAKTLHPNNVKKVIRALEYIRLNGRLFSLHNEEERQKESPYDFKYFVLNDYRDKLYDNIDKRVDIMIENGLIDEVNRLHSEGYKKDLNSMQGLGYKELLDYFDGDCTLEEAIANIKIGTRHFAKRQLTWFRREKSVTWLNKYEYDYDDNLILDKIINDIS